ncbi:MULTISPECIES: hypothetical protein [Bizionia]|uniref:DUF4890 domain-containing protein n=1 Tax=Bizionia algoritergicola TaxID=291187 RepID=A0A5D0QUJ4_9FLAO|nr:MULTISPECIES: hypothetical protein [Bizionia]OBX21504.1 hypothetical protein BAA08_12305 [Bizionia sp. APA-3]TYB72840.1 hypothetical protein ES675_09860 [Bizionia algoritergicola]
MKKIFLIALALVTIQMSAQDKKQMHKKGERTEKMQSYTPEEMAELQTKKLTLDLDLTEVQQKQVMALNLEGAKERKAMMEKRQELQKEKEAKSVSKDNKLKMKNDKLDKQIAMKAKMKEILNDEQYAKWEKLQKERMEKGRNSRKQKKHGK